MISSRAPTALTLAPISPDAEAVKPWSKPAGDQMLARPAYYPFVYEWEVRSVRGLAPGPKIAAPLGGAWL